MTGQYPTILYSAFIEIRMNRLTRVKKLEDKNKSDELILFLDFGNGYIKQVNGVNEHLTKEEYGRQTRDMRTIELI